MKGGYSNLTLHFHNILGQMITISTQLNHMHNEVINFNYDTIWKRTRNNFLTAELKHIPQGYETFIFAT
jgi:hypothetical protein